MIYTDPFGGSTIQPAQVGYSAIALAASITLAWPQDSFSPTQPVFSRLTDVTPSAGGFSVTLPDARRVSNGYDAFFSNRGAFTFTVNNAAGTPIATVTAGEVRYIYLVDNATEAGSWRSFGMGSLASPGDAASLVGRGLAADGAQLRISSQTSTFAASYTVVAADLGKTYVWTGGAGTLTLPAVAAVQIGSTFFFNVANQGTGALTIAASGGELVDGASSIVLQPSESAILHAGPTAWYTVGRGRNTQFNYTLLSKLITGGTVTLTPSEASNVVQVYTGVLVSTCVVVLPSVVQVYFVSNQTTGAFTTTFKTSGVGTTVTVPQGQNAVLLCDGLNIVNSSTTASGLSALQLAVGAVGSPSLSFVGDPTTGMYQIASGNVTFAITGVQTVNFSNAGITIPIAGGNLNFTSTGASPGQINYHGSGFLELATRNAAAGVKLYVANGALSTTWSAAGNVTIAAPSSGVALVASAFAGSNVANFLGGSSNGIISLQSTAAASVGVGVEAKNSVQTWQFGLGVGVGDSSWYLHDATRVAQPLKVTTAGNVTIAAPSSGNTVSATGFAGATVFNAVVPGGGVSYGYQGFNGTAQFSQFFDGANNAYVGTTTNHPLIIRSNNADRITLAAAGNVTIAAPGAGVAFTVSGGGLAVTGASILNGGVSGVTTLAIGGALTGATTGAFSGAVSTGPLTVTGASILNGGVSGVTTLAIGGALTGATTGAFSGAVSTGNLTVTGSTSGTVNVNATGQLYGSALHNNAGAVTGTTNQYVASGTYTPTLTNVANVTGSAAFPSQWMRVGNVVTVSGQFTLDPTSASVATQLGISLPIASDFANTYQCGGTAARVPSGVAIAAPIFADVTNNRAVLDVVMDTDVLSWPFAFSFTYLIV